MRKEIKKLIMVNNSKNNLIILFLVAVLIIACDNRNKNKIKDIQEVREQANIIDSPPKTNIDKKTQKELKNKDSVDGKPIEYYLRNKNCSVLAKNFYYGKFKPSDNDSTTALLNLAMIHDTSLRPFYFWCLNKIIGEADGALMELVGLPARKYVEKFPLEFTNYIESKSNQADKNNWVTAINYSGYYENEDADNKKKAAKNFISVIRYNCASCPKEVLTSAIRFANDCFKE